MVKLTEPMLCTSSTPASGRPASYFEPLMRTGQWVADVKMDGVRAIAHWSGQHLRIGNRHGVDITHRYPDVAERLRTVLGALPPVTIDGEIVAHGGFESTLMRDQQENRARIKAMVQQYPVTFFAFDIVDTGAATYVERRAALEALCAGWEDVEGLSITVTSDSEDFLAHTREAGLEGAVLKRKSSLYRPGTRSKNWIKFRNRYRVTCLVRSYVPGNGSRSEFGAMNLELIEGGDLVPIGTAGTGFSAREIPALKKALDAGEILTVEIECANQTSSRQLRFPVFRGVRTDVEPLDCVVEQLQFLPTC